MFDTKAQVRIADALDRIAQAQERIAEAMEQQLACQKAATLRSEAMLSASMDGSPVYQRYLDLVKNAGDA